MALEDVVESLDKVPADYRSLYVEDKAADGKSQFKLDLSRITDTVNLRKTMEKERATAQDEKRKREELEQRFAGIDPEQYRSLASRVTTDEDIKAILAGKTTFDEVVEKRMEKAREDDARKVQKAADERDSWQKRAAKLLSNALDGEIGKAANEAGLHKFAMRDAMLAAKADGFTIDDEGKVVMKEADGGIKYGKDGKTPFSLAEWFEEKKVSAPHWYPAGSSGSGAQGNSGARGSKPDYSKMTPAQKLTEARKQAAMRKN